MTGDATSMPQIPGPLRRWLVSTFPRLASFARRLRPSSLIFTRIYRENRWGGDESRSGNGSGVGETATVRAELANLIPALEVVTLVDAPCGDFTWMQHVDLHGAHYIGIDIVREMIDKCRLSHGGDRRDFVVGDLATIPVPRADLILCRDCLVHLSYRRIRQVLRNFRRSGSRYLLTTTYPDHHENQDIDDGSWRPLNLQEPPFRFPRPLRLIREKCTHIGQADKSLALYELADLDLNF